MILLQEAAERRPHKAMHNTVACEKQGEQKCLVTDVPGEDQQPVTLPVHQSFLRDPACGFGMSRYSVTVVIGLRRGVVDGMNTVDARQKTDESAYQVLPMILFPFFSARR